MPEPQNPYAAPQYQEEYPQAPVRLGGNLASLGQRFIGRLVDNLASAGVSLVLLFTIGDGLQVFNTKGTFEQLSTTLLFLVYALPFNALQWWLIASSGQSIGKKLANTRIVRDDGSPVGFGSGVVMREWIIVAVGSVPFVGTLFSIADAILIFVGHERKTLHDRIASTKVIDASVLFQTETETETELELAAAASDEPPPERRERRRRRKKPTRPPAFEPSDDVETPEASDS